ncbi:MAG: GNAT family N-acetyltransferase [Sarcina sp.]
MSIFRMPKEKRGNLKVVIKDWEETMLWSCMQGHMGEAYVDNIENPKSAQIIVGDFCLFVGEVNRELVENKEGMKSNFAIMMSNNDEWNKLVEEIYPKSLKKVSRYAIKKEKDVFNRKKLESVVDGLDKLYEIKLIDKDIYSKVIENEWSKDLCSNFDSAQDFCNRGLGVVILVDNEVVAGASSYAIYDNGIEVEIDTRKDYRRKGLAYITGAKLILECLDRGIYPSWDAQNLWSVALSEKLGYHFDYEYTAYEVWW